MTFSEILTLIAAVYGASLSTYLGIKEINRHKRKILVTCRMALTPNPSGGEPWRFVSVQAYNDGHRPVEIKMSGLNLNTGELFTQVESRLGSIPLPKIIGDGESVDIYFDLDAIESILQRDPSEDLYYTKAFVRDASGKDYTTKLPKVFKDRNLSKQ